jgi:A/G-specific adenine glycosylase
VTIETRPALLRRRLLQWWKQNRREFPWRNTRDPYHLLVAEVLLHRTRATQVVNLFHGVLEAYPTVSELAAADPDQLQQLLQSAGLRWRVTLLWHAANEIVCRFGGRIPRARADLESIPGIGHYIASAVRCFAFGEADAIVDSNVVRVYGRVFDLLITDGLRRDRDFHKLAQSLVDPNHPREFNLALLDLADAVCTPRSPKCEQCPLLKHCAYGTRVLRFSQQPSVLPDLR